MKIIVEMRYGSHLYGTNTDDSDLDFKGIFMPSKREIFLNKIPKSITMNTNNTNVKNSSDDIDKEFYSLHYFIKLALSGETVSIDMLHANEENILTTSDVWKSLVSNREKFYTRKLKSFAGYARKQAMKFSDKGKYLSSVKEVLSFLSKCDETIRLKDIWNTLPVFDNIVVKLKPDSHSKLCEYSVCGRRFQETSRIGYVIDALRKVESGYGNRARKAEEAGGIDYKALSHALRAVYQMKSILEIGTIVFPLKEADFLRAVKLGEIPYETILDNLDVGMLLVEELMKKSSLPEKPDVEFWENWLFETIEKEINKNFS